MSENVSTASGADPIGKPRALHGIVFGGLAIGVLDILDAFTFFGLWFGAPPQRILQSVASGVLGRQAAISGGWKTAALGLALHFLNATIIATIYYLATLKLPVLLHHAVICGLLFGVVCHFVMSYVVVPLSRATPGRFSVPVLLNGIIFHALLVGLPPALINRWSAKRNLAR